MWSYRETWASVCLPRSDQIDKKPICCFRLFLPLPVLQVSVSTGTKKLVAATAFGAISLLFLARRFQRRKGRKKALSPQWEQAGFEFFSPASAENGKTSWHCDISFLLNQQLSGLWSPFSVLAQLLVCDVIRLMRITLNCKPQVPDKCFNSFNLT